MQAMIFGQCAARRLKGWTLRAVWAALLVSATSTWAAVIGEVEFSRGVSMARAEGQNPRMLGQGLALNDGDRLTTADEATAIVKLQDGTRLTLRPQTELVFRQYRFQPGALDNSMVIELLSGGFRAVTGQIPKNSPDAAKVLTKSATLSIRGTGTDFDARLCDQDCKQESAKVPEKPRPTVIQASAKLVSAQGAITALDSAGARRQLSVGAAVYGGETVETGANATTILVFHDDSRMTLGANTQFRVDNYVYEEAKASEGRSFLSLVRGSMRALTGLIGKENKSNVGYITPTATIGIRGTGFDSDCPLPGDGNDACSFYTWLGTIAVTPTGQTVPRLLSEGQGVFVSKTEVKTLSAPILQNLQRPDSVKVDIGQLFTLSTLNEESAGLYVFVRDGTVELSTPSALLFLSRGETGFAGNDGTVLRPQFEPLFIEFDQTPLPNSNNPLLMTVLNDYRIRAAEQCP